MAQPFSTEEVAQATKNFEEKKPTFLSAHDGIQLAYYPFVPQAPKAVVVFYHGGASWSKAIYQLMAQETSQQHEIAVYLFDVRGHGHSQGPRGDAPSAQQVWDDIDVALDFVKKQHPYLPVILAGHSSGAGLILNYLKQGKNEKADAYVFLAPFLGTDAGTDIKYTEPEKEFVNKVNLWALIAHALTGGWLFAHTPAVFFNYASVKKTDPLTLSYYTCAMATAAFPREAKNILMKVSKPCGIFIGQHDERFDPNKVVAYQEFLSNKQSIAEVIPEANHLSIVLKTPALFEKMRQRLEAI